MAKPWSFKLAVQGSIPAGEPPNGLPDLDWSHAVSRLVQNGSTTGKADLVSLTEETIASGATLALDMTAFVSGGMVRFSDGMPFNFADVQALVIIADRTNTTSVTVQKAGSNGWTGPVGNGAKALAAGEVLAVFSRMTVSGTNKALDIVNGSGAAAKVKIIVVGRAA